MEVKAFKWMCVVILLTVSCHFLKAQRPRPCSAQGRTECPTTQSNFKLPTIVSTSRFIVINTTMCPPYDNPHWTNPAQACDFMTTYRIPLSPKDAAVPIPLASKLQVFENITYLKEDPEPLLGPIGVMKSGVNIFGVGSPCGYSSKCPNDGGPSKYVDAVESEGHTVDQCGGHAAPTNQYHIHSGIGIATDSGRTKCALDTDTAGQHSVLLGWMFDGYGLYGQHSLNGDIPTDLDECGGHSHMLNGVETYHYHLPSPVQFPWTIACYKGCPELSNNQREFGKFANPPYNCPK